ncbi:hypothetical protein HD597_000856 [Nonomuraea thailandensis]|uniref:Integrase catalytic domain-containing protein n=1 Tax=Nonomuraea thailandensis TaxID=1188745 RepID=A0A9X2GED6_9ACTN|nr:hypothetical protein [Nonomuraea thailandensis]
MRDAITKEITGLPEQLRRSLTWDRGTELAQHAQLRIETGVQVSFADPHSPWQRGTNENTSTACCGRTFPRAPTCPAGMPRSWLLSRSHSTPGPERPSDEEHRLRLSASTYTRCRAAVLRRPVEPKNYTSDDFGRFLTGLHIRRSVGRTGVCWDNAMAESFFSAIKNEWLHRFVFTTRAKAKRQVIRYPRSA